MDYTKRSLSDAQLEKLFEEVAAEVEAARAAGGSPNGPRFATEEEFIAHIAAECEKEGMPKLIEAMVGLGKILGPPSGYQGGPATESASRREQLQALNSNELNQACRKYLGEPDHRDDLYCLDLALWGLMEVNIRFPAGSPTEGELLEMVDCLMHWPPAKAYEWLTNENGTYGEDVFLTARELADMDAESAACVILDTIGGRMDELGPDRFA